MGLVGLSLGCACVVAGLVWGMGNEGTRMGFLDVVKRVGSAVGDNYAIGALGWDFLVSVASAGAWSVGVEGGGG